MLLRRQSSLSLAARTFEDRHFVFRRSRLHFVLRVALPAAVGGSLTSRVYRLLPNHPDPVYSTATA